jgi:hypothetical protein
MPIPFAERFSCTIDNACEASGLGRTSIYGAIADGRLKTVIVGKHRLVLVSSLIRMIDPDAKAEPTAPEAA